MNTSTLTKTGRRMAVRLDPNAKAKVTRPPTQWRNETSVVLAKMARFDVTREPDFVDEAEGEVVWIADTFAVTVPLERLRDFRSFISARGLAPCGRGAYRVESFIMGDEVRWDRLYAGVRPQD